MSADAAWLLIFMSCCYVAWYFYDRASDQDNNNPFDGWGW